MWVWVALSLTWAVVALGAALWLGASAKAVEQREQQVLHTWDDELVEREWRDVA